MGNGTAGPRPNVVKRMKVKSHPATSSTVRGREYVIRTTAVAAWPDVHVPLTRSATAERS